MLMKSGIQPIFLVVWELDIDEGCRVRPYFLKYIYIYNLKNVECIIPLIHHMYRSFLRVVHLKSLLIFGSRLKRRVPFSLGLITQTSGYQP